MRDNRPIVWLERLLFVVGVTCVGWFGLVTVGAAVYQRGQTAEFERLRALESLPAPPPAAEPIASYASDSLIGMLDIPRLSLSTPIIAGDDRGTLEIAVGHLPDTPRPWELGNSAIAAHRDGLFRSLKDIRIGDQVIVRTVRGDLEYRVRDTRIVKPDDLSVLAPTEAQRLTLITCYPFNYIGSAPKRFIVHADRVTTPTAAAPLITTASFNPALTERKEAVTERKISRVVSKPPKPKRKARAPLKPASSLKTRPKAAGGVGEPAPSAAKAGKPKGKNFFKKIAGFFKGPKREPTPPAPSRSRR